jgi:hypothetical protein
MEFISHCVKRNPNKLAGRATSGMLIMLLVLSLLGWIYLTQASQVATTGRRIEKLQAKRAAIERENMVLAAEIAEWESIGSLMARAEKLGFEPVAPGSTEYVAGVVPNTVEAPVEERSDQDVGGGTPVQKASWLDSVLAQFPEWARADSR